MTGYGKAATRRPLDLRGFEVPAKVTAPATIALSPAFLGFEDGLTVTDLNDFNGPAQTTNLGVRSSNLFGRTIQYLSANPEWTHSGWSGLLFRARLCCL